MGMGQWFRLPYTVLALLFACEAFRVGPQHGIAHRLRPTSRLQSVQDEEQVRDSLKLLTEAPIGSTSEALSDFNRVDEETISRLKTKRAYVSILTERLFQTMDDFQLSSKTKTAVERTFVSLSEARERIVILGAGWGSVAFLKTIDSSKYDVTVVSPRDHFVFTPMLAASAIGTVDFRSVMEPIRDSNPLVNYVEAVCDGVDAARQTVHCQSVRCEGTSCEVTDFELPYDHLIVAVGATVNTFGIKGVRDYCHFLKQVDDARGLRRIIVHSFERANVPNTSDEEKRNALSFVIVGAGPTGVEFTSELRDWMEVEGRRYYPHLLKYVSISLVEAGSAILSVFEKNAQEEGLRHLQTRTTKLIADGIIAEEMTKVSLNVGVKEITDKHILLSSGDKMPYGFCLWAAGNGPNPLILNIVESIEEQKNLQSQARGRLVVDNWLRAKGAMGIYGIGDCSFVDSGALPPNAQVASQQGSYLGRLFSKGFNFKNSDVPFKKVGEAGDVEYISETVKLGNIGISPNSNKEIEYAKPFQFLNLGVLAYIGASEALAQVNVDDNVLFGKGAFGFWIWRGIYWFKQVSWRNRVLVTFDWIKARAFGRDIGSV